MSVAGVGSLSQRSYNPILLFVWAHGGAGLRPPISDERKARKKEASDGGVARQRCFLGGAAFITPRGV